MIKRILCIFLCVATIFCSCFLLVSAEESDIYDFKFNTDDIIIPSSYDSYLIYDYSNYGGYIVFFNSYDYTGVTLSGDNFLLNFSGSTPYPYYRLIKGYSSSFLVYSAFYSTFDCSFFLDKANSNANSVTCKKDGFLMTNFSTLRSDATALGCSFRDSFFCFYNISNDKNYTIWSDYNYIYYVSISTDLLNYNASQNSLSPSKNNMYTFSFSTYDSAIDFIKTGNISNSLKVVGGSFTGIREFFYTSTSVINTVDGSVYFSTKTVTGSGSSDDNSSWFQSIIDNIKGLGDKITNFFSTIKDGFDSVLDAITFPFDWAKGKVEEFLNNFDFINNIIVFGDMFSDFIQEDHSDPPEIRVDLSVADSKYNYGVSASAIDLSWYGKTWKNSGICLKDIGDVVISSFLWLFFLWNLYKNLPNLISGGSMITEKWSSKDSKTASHRPKDN